MDINHPLALLGGLTPTQFMRRHWQKKPLLVRQAVPGFVPELNRAALFKMASQDAVESRLIVQNTDGWRMESGPMPVRKLPPVSQSGWTLLLQGMNLHHPQADALMQQFRFVPDARLDDVMISYATPGGGVGPHFDSYDVFLFQASGQRRWRIGRQKDLTLQSDVPLKILQNFEPDEEFVLEAGDMLYLPPRYAHDGVAQACVAEDGQALDCMTYSIGFRAPARQELGAELLHRLADFHEDADGAGAGNSAEPAASPTAGLYQDAAQLATAEPAAIPSALQAFASQAVLDTLKDPLTMACVLGEYMTEPKPSVWFDEADAQCTAETLKRAQHGLQLDPRTRMMYDEHHIFINGESYRAKGKDAELMRRLANVRALSAAELRVASAAARGLLADWYDAGWLRGAA